MEKQASMDLWKSLYEAVIELKVLEPWKDLWDLDLIGIQEPGWEEPIFCSVMGMQGEGYGIAAYEGTEGLGSLNMILRCEEGIFDSGYMMFEQSALTCYWGSRIEVPEDQLKRIKELGYKFRGKNGWPYFLSFCPRYAPDTPKEEEVRKLTALYLQLTEAVKALREKRVAVNFEKGEFLFRYFDGEQLMWYSAPAKLPYVEMQYPVMKIEDLSLEEKIKEKEKNGAELLLDFVYLGGALHREGEHRPLNPLLFIGYDVSKDMVLAVNPIEPDEKESEMAAAFFMDYIRQFGRPAKVSSRNPWILSALKEICIQCEIEIEARALPEIEQILKDLQLKTE